MPSISCNDLTFTWPDGTTILDGVDLSLGPGRAGLVGRNGVGKSTLLRLLTGRLQATRGSVTVDGVVAYLPQHITLQAHRRVDEVLGIARVRAAMRALGHGDVSALDDVGDAWGVDERALATLDRLGLAHVELDRTVGDLSGGESMLLALAGLLLRAPDVLLLDEPTNNLDADHRTHLYDTVDRFRGVVLVVSHDRALLDRVDHIVDLRDGGLGVHGGNLHAYERQIAAEQHAAQRTVRAAEADVRRQRRELIDARTKLDRRVRAGRKAERDKRLPKVVAQERKRQAQVSAGKLRDLQMRRLDEARTHLVAAEAAVHDDDEIRIDLPATSVPSRHTVLHCEALRVELPDGRPLWRRPIDLSARGPERIALTGPNGAGKTTLLRLIVGQLKPTRGHLRVGVDGIGYLPQRLDLLDGDATVLDNLRRHAPDATDNQRRAAIARLLLRGDRALQPARELSGGERFRATLATVLFGHPPPQLLLIDEPTNNLDLASVRQLRQALAAYQGALVVASHDQPFLDDLAITRWIRVDYDHGLTEESGES